ncbi:hypothetical protein [Haloplasma contractile]|uniref:Uncharacterized protein n=1 Tax=Haloplasma contractile SSD-17B TaxID=1033810 RepID=U2DV96_9MOLU|nr:hypothetical protein [Haloplasma contractile]ERJ12317.1 hypothetical protein HLPCO_001303 [Haloplasma contractile SSD-17B]
MPKKKAADNEILFMWVIIILTPIIGLLIEHVFNLMTNNMRRIATIVGLLLFVILVGIWGGEWYFPILGLLRLAFQ